MNGWNEENCVSVCGLGWERERERRERERGDEINNKKRIKKYYLNRINCRIDKLMWVVLKSGYVKIEKVGS